MNQFGVILYNLTRSFLLSSLITGGSSAEIPGAAGKWTKAPFGGYEAPRCRQTFTGGGAQANNSAGRARSPGSCLKEDCGKEGKKAQKLIMVF